MNYKTTKIHFANEILPILLKDRKEGQYFVSPFCGGCDIVDKVKGNVIASDINYWLITLWKGLQKDLDRPYFLNRENYEIAKLCYNRQDNFYNDFETAWVGFSFMKNKLFRDKIKGTTNIEYVRDNIEKFERKRLKMEHVSFFNLDYRKLDIPQKSIVYLDIPNETVRTHKSKVTKFDYDAFINWCKRVRKEKGHSIFVSEFDRVERFKKDLDFELVWEKDNKEKLFKLT